MRAQAPLGRLIGVAMICAGRGTVSVATPEVAPAATSDSPTAIAVAPNGTSYVGFSTGGKLVRISSSGKLKGGVELDQDEAVDGLFATNGGEIWVDYESGVSLLGPTGTVKTHFDHDPVRTCDSSSPASRYGGITANGNRIYVANRCHDSMSVYARNGDLAATVKLPGRPRGITYGGPQAGRPAFVYVALPDQGKVLAFKASSLRDSSKPAHTYTLKKPAGGKKPAPGGIAVDKYGQLAVSDMANNALYLLDANHDFSLYRTLGHPPRASRAAGRLNNPTAIAQHAQDGGGLSGNLFIADTNNNRVQRWDTGGYTFWSKGVHPGSGGGGGGGGGGGSTGNGPANITPPSISGTPAVGERLTCNKGTWDEGEDLVLYSYTWRRDGTTITGANSPTYLVVAADDGTKITCVVRASNADGNTEKSSDPVTIGGGGGGSGPTNSDPPTITGTAAVGQVLTCNPGTWSGTGITYAYAWKRDGAAIDGAGAQTYTVVAADNGKALTCAVTATNASGSRTVTSAAVTVGGAGTGPVNTVPPAITGTATPGQVLTCNPGTWTGTGITYTYVWRRGGTVVGTGPTYTLVADDAGTSFTCTVTATFAAGSTTLTSAAFAVPALPLVAPTNTTPPSIAGTPAAGQTLTCNPGVWTGSPTFAYLWRRNGANTGVTTATYPVTVTDAGTSLVCTVIATNSVGNGAASSPAVSVADANPPTNNGSPSLTGGGAVGTALACEKGVWTGTNLTYRYSWSRNGAPIPDTGSDHYVVLSEDQGKSLTCTVTARNAAGSTLATTSGRVVPAVVAGAPTPTAAPSITGTAALGQTLTCDTGTWTGDPTITFTTIWQRDGETLGAGPTHVVVAADQAATLRCVVVASNGTTSKGAARSAPVGGGACDGPVGVVINDGDADTASPDVQLSVRAPAGTTTLLISNSADMSGATSVPVSGTCTYPWRLDSIPGLPLTWSVYVQFDGTGTPVTDSIRVNQPARPLLVW